MGCGEHEQGRTMDNENLLEFFSCPWIYQNCKAFTPKLKTKLRITSAYDVYSYCRWVVCLTLLVPARAIFTPVVFD